MDTPPNLPIPISLVHGRYLLSSIQVVSYLRRNYHICGAFVGTIPQSPSQNVFLGLPVELMPEEAQILVSKGVAFIIDDVRAHQQIVQRATAERKEQYAAMLQEDAQQASKMQLERKSQRREKSLKKNSSSPSTDISEAAPAGEKTPSNTSEDQNSATPTNDGETSLSSAASPNTPQSFLKPLEILKYNVTPATSELLLPPSPPPTPSSTPPPPIPDLPASYPLFKHLHERGYFLSPGLRFGCQYTAYPGDPLRFHSHFLAVGTQWDEEIDLMDIVGGGRLGTGVKKAYLFGGADPKGDVKTFSVEWAGM